VSHVVVCVDEQKEPQKKKEKTRGGEEELVVITHPDFPNASEMRPFFLFQDES
jgi:hypothetical protein